MPILSQLQLPLPKNFAEFEDIVTSAMGNRNSGSVPRRFGRSGQAQYGIDIQFDDNLARNTGVQCRLVASFSLEDLKEAVADAEHFSPALDNFYIALGLPRDAKLQKAALELSGKRASKGLFRVGILFWEDIVDDLAREPAELSKHYPHLFPVGAAQAASGTGVLRDQLGLRRYEALRDLGTLRLRCLPTRNRPMDWDEACEIIALDLTAHAKRIAQFRAAYVGDLPREVDASLLSAEVSAEDGGFDLQQFGNDLDVPRAASKAAGAMFDHLTKAEDDLRAALEKDHGLRF